MSKTLIGLDNEVGKIICVLDDYRCSGLYILGKPGMGKSSLLINLMRDNIYKNGLFFIDPHGDAINGLIRCANDHGKGYYYLLDLEEEHYSFGINPLYCRNLTSLKERTDTYTRAYNIFHKIWEDDWGVWLQLIIQNTLYAFIENPNYTLAEVPLFLTNENFRYQIAKNIKYNLDVRDFWLARFEGKKPLDQQRQVDAALTRISTLLGHPYVKHIVGQQKSTIDFNRILSKREIVLVKLSSALAEDIKKFVGTILISELLHATRNRPKEEVDSIFYIYVDEFQNFASSDDFATLITEARKFGIATTIAHQERFGQLGDNKKLLGATLAAANKIYFQLSVKDAQELAPELAEMSSNIAERREADLVISPHAVEDMWNKGHPNLDIMEYHRKYFWILDLLKKNPEDGYYFFNPETVSPEYIRAFEGITKTKIAWNEFTDWEDYRASPQMIQQGIALLDDYYYKCMQLKYNPVGQITSEEFDYLWKVIELLGGILGLRPVMESYIANDMREVFLKKITEVKDKTITEMRRKNRYSDISEWERKEFQWELEEVNPDFRINWSIDSFPDSLPFRFNRIEWRNRAIKAGFTQAELSNFIKWRIKKFSSRDEQILKDYIMLSLGRRAENLIDHVTKNLALSQYMSIMSADPYYEKYRGAGMKMPPEKTASYRRVISDRVFSQSGTMQEFIFYCFCALPATLIVQPLKISSSHYQESVKRDITQRELIDKMAQELSSLPRFHAWTKILQEENGQQSVEKHKIETFPMPEDDGAEKLKPFPLENFCKLRSGIEEEIAERQAMWKRGLSSPSAEKKTERQADTTSKPPPTTTSG